ncbi:MAG: CusA/CzcA family heavy metal efflux RND transporter, partial [Bradyrhizobium sp.]|nr:CusA/CzcA family heavy metal efflux RND transporter [Bradyrhizobium sp.]
MIDTLLSFAIRQRHLVLIAVLAMAALGIWNFSELPIDAVPDITNMQVQIYSRAPGYSPLEMEQRVTFPIETAMAGLPRLENTRSLSRYGISQVTVIFKDGTDIYFARQLVGERIQQVRDQLPPGIESAIGPISTGLGEIFMYTIEARPGATKADGSAYSGTDLRTVQDWIVRPRLRTVAGVNEVNSVGGFEKQFHVLPDPTQLMAYRLTFHDVMAALAANNGNVGAGYIERNGEQYLVRTPGQVAGLDEIRDIVIGSRNGVPVRISDVAEVREGTDLRIGAATLNGNEVVLGTAMLLIGENSRTVAQRVAAKLKEITASLPEGVIARTVYDRTNLVDATIATVAKNLLEGAALVIAVLFLILGNFRAAIATACVIPLAMLFTITGMLQNRISANLMSLGAIDFGIIVDGAVIIVENCLRLLAVEQKRLGRILSQEERFATILAGSREVIRPSLFGTFIIAAVYLPILTLSGVEGKMFTPMALTVLMALAGASILSLTFVPASVALLVTGRIAEHENLFMRGARAIYVPLLDASLRSRFGVVSIAVLLVIVCGIAATKMGGEFIPSLDEGDASMEVLRIPGTSLTQAVEMQEMLEKSLLKLPEVMDVFARTGAAEIATDPVPPSATDGYVMLKPRAEWPDPAKPKAVIVAELRDAMDDVPGNLTTLSQPIQQRMNETVAGIRTDVGVKIFGDDLDVLLPLASRVQAILQKIEGAADVRAEQVEGLPVLTVKVDRQALSRYGINIADVQNLVEIAVAGKSAGKLFEGDRRFDIVVRLPEHLRSDIEALKSLPIPLPAVEREVKAAPALWGNSPLAQIRYVPLSELAEVSLAAGPNQISREEGKRRI